jgi:hypothetical protein
MASVNQFSILPYPTMGPIQPPVGGEQTTKLVCTPIPCNCCPPTPPELPPEGPIMFEAQQCDPCSNSCNTPSPTPPAPNENCPDIVCACPLILKYSCKTEPDSPSDPSDPSGGYSDPSGDFPTDPTWTPPMPTGPTVPPPITAGPAPSLDPIGHLAAGWRRSVPRGRYLHCFHREFPSFRQSCRRSRAGRRSDLLYPFTLVDRHIPLARVVRVGRQDLGKCRWLLHQIHPRHLRMFLRQFPRRRRQLRRFRRHRHRARALPRALIRPPRCTRLIPRCRAAEAAIEQLTFGFDRSRGMQFPQKGPIPISSTRGRRKYRRDASHALTSTRPMVG